MHTQKRMGNTEQTLIFTKLFYDRSENRKKWSYWLLNELSPNKSSPVTLAVANSGNTTTFLRNCSLRCCGLWSRRLWRWILRRRGLWSCRPIFWLDGHSTARTGILSFKPNTMEKLIPDYYPMGKLTKVWCNWCGTCAKMKDSLRLHLLINFNL